MYSGYREQLELLSIEQRGVWITAILNYVNGLELPEMDVPVQMMFSIAKTNLDRDISKWIDTVEKRRTAGILGGYAKARKNDLANASFASICQKDLPDTGNDTVTVNESVNSNAGGRPSNSVYGTKETAQKSYRKKQINQARLGIEHGTDYNRLIEQELIEQLNEMDEGGDVSGHH